MTTAIEWTDETWNPTTGCDKVSPGCDHCYIERTIPFRMEGRRFDEKGKMGVRLHPDRLDKPLHWRKPRRVFVNSLSDLFHPGVRYEFIREVFNVMRTCSGLVRAADGYRYPTHTFQVLTKRPQRMAELATTRALGYDPERPPANVWLGTSIENDHYAFRADHLRATPAAVRFLSLEPLLGPLPSLDLTGIDWVITGGESGSNARPSHPDWFRDVRDRCVAAGVPYFHKQNGEWWPVPPGLQFVSRKPEVWVQPDGVVRKPHEALPCPGIQLMQRVGKKAAGRELDGRTWDEMPKR